MATDYEGAFFHACPNVVASDLPTGSALLDMRAGKYYSLNIVGAHIWKYIQSPATLQSLVASITETFSVEWDDCTRDTTALLTALISAGLAEVSSVRAVEAIG